MSYVADTILVFSILEDEEARLGDVNSVLDSAAHGQHFTANIADFDMAIIGGGHGYEGREVRVYGGSKALQTPTFVGAFNGLRIDELCSGLAAIAWECPEEVQLLVSNEEDEPSHYTQRYPMPLEHQLKALAEQPEKLKALLESELAAPMRTAIESSLEAAWDMAVKTELTAMLQGLALIKTGEKDGVMSPGLLVAIGVIQRRLDALGKI